MTGMHSWLLFLNGGSSGSWKKSTRAFDQNLVGSPGKRHFKGAVSLLSASTIDRSKVIVNEIGNSKELVKTGLSSAILTLMSPITWRITI